MRCSIRLLINYFQTGEIQFHTLVSVQLVLVCACKAVVVVIYITFCLLWTPYLPQLNPNFTPNILQHLPELSQLNPNFTPDLSQLNPNFTPDLSQLNPNFTPDLSQLNPNSTPNLSQLNPNFTPGPRPSAESPGQMKATPKGESLQICICNFHVLNHLLLIYICKLHWNLNTMFVCQVNYL